ncbi:MAG: FAD-dependent oxidoreductase [Chloroflexi bacterium]|nr:FAD-dependent oxidoreductase [Chloroflexota bacterium]
MQGLKHLFQPLKIGSMEVQNRIVMSPMCPGFGVDENGCVTEELIEFTAERARSRPGMITTGVIPVSFMGGTDAMEMPRIYDPKALPSLEQWVKAVHQYEGVKFGAQLNHCGPSHSYFKPMDAVAASAVPGLAELLVKVPVREATRDELKECVQDFAAAAERSLSVGFDYIEIHAAHGYLINTFLCPYYNHRTDEYGGSFENRIRFLLEVIRGIRSRIGYGVPLGVRINGDDFIGEQGWHIADLCRLAPILERESVNYISVTVAGTSIHSSQYMIASMYQEQGFNAGFSSEVKKQVSIPVAVVGRIVSPIVADRMIAEGKADLAVMARAMLADPDLVEKARMGELADIRPCIGECLGCIWQIMVTGVGSCTVNPRVGREHSLKDVAGSKKSASKKVLVVGAGCAGLEAARMAAFYGHKVTVCESRGWIGGQLKLAAKMPKRQEIGGIIPWYERQLHKLGVEVRLNTAVDGSLLKQIKPDVVILATGSLPEVPLGFLNGLENIKDIEMVMVDELIGEERLAGDSVLVVGGDQMGVQVADYLTEMGKTVYVVEKGPQFAPKMAYNDSFFLLQRLTDKGVKMYDNVEKVEILPDDEIWIVRRGTREKLPPVETIVLASDRRPNVYLGEVAEKAGSETHIIGDASGVAAEGQGTLMAAISAGYNAGRQI